MALLEKDNVFLIDTKNYEQKLLYIKENYDQNATMSLVDVIDGYYVFAFCKDTAFFSNTKVDETINILETATSVDEINSNFIYCGVKTDSIYDKNAPVFLKLTNVKDKSCSVFRARLIEGGGRFAVITSVRNTDLLVPSEYTVSILQKIHDTDTEYISTVDVKLSE